MSDVLFTITESMASSSSSDLICLVVLGLLIRIMSVGFATLKRMQIVGKIIMKLCNLTNQNKNSLYLIPKRLNIFSHLSKQGSYPTLRTFQSWKIKTPYPFFKLKSKSDSVEKFFLPEEFHLQSQ
jgi:hypothetical protein